MTTSQVQPDVSGRNATYKGLVLGMGSVGYLPLGETNGTVAEDLASGNDGTHISSPSLGLSGPIARVAGGSRAVYYDGTNHTTTQISVNPQQPLTVSQWVNYDTFAGIQVSFGVAVSGNAFYLGVRAGDLFYGVGDMQRFVVAVGVPAGDWFLATLAVNGTTAKYYVNGVEKDSIGYTSPGVIASPPFVGIVNLGASEAFAFAGKTAHAAVFNSTLTIAEIETLYLCGLNGQ